MAISQGSNLINVVVHNGADSRDASLRTIILCHVLIGGEKCGSFLLAAAPPAVQLIPFISMEASSTICIFCTWLRLSCGAGWNSNGLRCCRWRLQGRRQIRVDDGGGRGRGGG